MHKRIFTGSPWESKVGYCRALKVGNHVYVSGTVSIDDDGNVFAKEDPYGQTMRCFEIIEKALSELDVPLASVVRTRIFVTDITLWESFAKAHYHCFKDSPPVTTMVEVKRLIDPALLIEVEAEAVWQS